MMKIIEVYNQRRVELEQKTTKINLRRLESFKRLINLFLAAVCLLLETVVFSYHWYVHFSGSLVEDLHFYQRGHLLQIGIYVVMLLFFSKTYGGMRIGYLKNTEVIFSQILATLAVNVLTYAQLSLMAMELFMLRFFLQMTFLQVLVIIAWINIANRIYHSVFPPRKLLLIHGSRPIEDIRNKFADRKDKYEIVNCMQVDVGIDEICREITAGFESGIYHAVVIWDISALERNILLKFCYARSIRFYIMPKITDVILLGSEELNLFDTPLLLTREYCMTMEQRFFKRMMDFLLAILLLLITAPVMAVTAVIIKLYDGGPVLYKQIRCTENQREFNIMKFRSMRMDAEKDGVARLAQKNDSRITPVGRFIRKVRIDELPQLVNIIKGDMSFIGPRPERPQIIEQYMEIMPEFAYRMKVKAGLAGYAQIYGKYNTSPYDKLKLDLTYIENYSIWLDAKLMLLTLKILFWPDSTEGVESEQVTAFKEKFGKEHQYMEKGKEWKEQKEPE